MCNLAFDELEDLNLMFNEINDISLLEKAELPRLKHLNFLILKC